MPFSQEWFSCASRGANGSSTITIRSNATCKVEISAAIRVCRMAEIPSTPSMYTRNIRLPLSSKSKSYTFSALKLPWSLSPSTCSLQKAGKTELMKKMNCFEHFSMITHLVFRLQTSIRLKDDALKQHCFSLPPDWVNVSIVWLLKERASSLLARG